ncbi:Fe-S cluster biogenesis protein NfuA/nitrite reductase/ring-hydroxylating ferredoxin subunit [Marmoricola sp. URHA0025 HA25]
MSEVIVRPDRGILPEDREVEDLAGALDEALAGIELLDGPQRVAVDAVRTALDDVHRAMLVHVVRSLKSDERGRELLFELVDDPRVRMVLLMHGLIRPDPLTAAREALDAVRPQLQSHGGDVSLDRIEDGVAYVRLSGACNGCSMSAVTMRNGVEQALKERVPGVTGVEVLPNEPGPALIGLSEIGLRTAGPQPGWADAGLIADFDLGAVSQRDLVSEDGVRGDAVVVNLAGQLAAYVNSCPHLGNSLDDAEIDVVAGTLTCQWHGFCFDALSGDCQTLPGAQLQQLPLRVEDGRVWIRVAG